VRFIEGHDQHKILIAETLQRLSQSSRESDFRKLDELSRLVFGGCGQVVSDFIPFINWASLAQSVYISVYMQVVYGWLGAGEN